ncbi:anti-sigma factor domain-containing protein [Bacillus sp. HMF5848]|uniref:anti-sigma factor domain-containing protein n=1 Tax=Bacillus sp. HMF5848 TaxID=2495421 RepID=UPI000F7698B5|nr:anti-sigma factor domain-containing protein [Bacillus sp. HMF5848]RSK26703.1 anti-sigma factor domain-containing protein [Bacillus sp. HMF5848]
MKKGVILEINKNYVTLLTPDGQFVKSQVPYDDKIELGQEITYIPVQAKRPVVVSPFSMLHVKKWSAAVLVAILLLAFIPFYNSQQVYAYMSIDINPSIELSLNKKLKVISITPMNDDGERIVTELTGWRNKPADTVALMIIEKSKQTGYITEDETAVYVTTVIKKENANTEAIKKTVESVKTLTTSDKIAIVTVESSLDTRNEAVKQGKSTLELEKKNIVNDDDHDIKGNLNHNPPGLENKENRGLEKGKSSEVDNKEPNSPEKVNGKGRNNGNGIKKDEQDSNKNEQNRGESNNKEKRNENGKSKGEDKTKNNNGAGKDNADKGIGIGKGKEKENNNNKDKEDKGNGPKTKDNNKGKDN